jgi:hypothetical protein
LATNDVWEAGGHNAYACVGYVQERLFIHAGQCRAALPEQ